MASEIRVNKITHTAGVGTVTTNTHGIVIAGICTAESFSGSGVVGWNQVAKPLQCHVNSSGIQMMHNDSGGAKHLSNNDVSGNRLIGAATYFTGT